MRVACLPALTFVFSLLFSVSATADLKRGSCVSAESFSETMKNSGYYPVMVGYEIHFDEIGLKSSQELVAVGEVKISRQQLLGLDLLMMLNPLPGFEQSVKAGYAKIEDKDKYIARQIWLFHQKLEKYHASAELHAVYWNPRSSHGVYVWKALEIYARDGLGLYRVSKDVCISTEYKQMELFGARGNASYGSTIPADKKSCAELSDISFTCSSAKLQMADAKSRGEVLVMRAITVDGDVELLTLNIARKIGARYLSNSTGDIVLNDRRYVNISAVDPKEIPGYKQ